MTNDELVAVISAWLSGGPGAAAELRGRWDPAAPAWQRCLLAHYAADTEPTPEAALIWDDRALAAAMELAPGEPGPMGLHRDAMLPSLHLNCAENHRRLGETAKAAAHLAAGRANLGSLDDDGYGRLISSGLDRLATRLDAGLLDSTTAALR
jgi:hypothetical protein